MSIRIGFMASLGFAGMSPDAVCRTLSEIGYESVEWTLAHCDPRNVSVEQLRQLVRTTKDHGLTLSEVVVQQDYVTLDPDIHRQCVDYLRKVLDNDIALAARISMKAIQQVRR